MATIIFNPFRSTQASRPPQLTGQQMVAIMQRRDRKPRKYYLIVDSNGQLPIDGNNKLLVVR